MPTLKFGTDNEAQEFAAELLRVHDKTQICYSYERVGEIEFWWEYTTLMNTDARLDEEEEKRETIKGLFLFLSEKGIDWE